MRAACRWDRGINFTIVGQVEREKGGLAFENDSHYGEVDEMDFLFSGGCDYVGRGVSRVFSWWRRGA